MQPEPFRIDRTPSVPPGVTWPMVWYKLVNELPSMMAVLGCVGVALVLVLKVPNSAMEAILTVLVGSQSTGLFRSKPAGDR